MDATPKPLNSHGHAGRGSPLHREPIVFEFLVSQHIVLSRFVKITAGNEGSAREALDQTIRTGSMPDWREVQVYHPGWTRKNDVTHYIRIRVGSPEPRAPEPEPRMD